MVGVLAGSGLKDRGFGQGVVVAEDDAGTGPTHRHLLTPSAQTSRSQTSFRRRASSIADTVWEV